MDESGVKGTDRVLVLAGFISGAETWLGFSVAWQDCLSAAPSIQYLKMSEAAKLDGQFRGWSGKEVNSKLTALAQVIKRFPPKLATHISIDLPAFKRFRERVPAPASVSDPYFFALDTILPMICKDAFDLGEREKVDVIFDEHVIFGPRAIMWYPMIREAVVSAEPHLESVMPSTPQFRNDLKFLPLQASDMLAWLLRNQPRFAWLMELLCSTVQMSHRAHIFNNSSLGRTADLTPLLRREFTPEWHARWRKKMGLNDKMLRGYKRKKRK
ncbi:MAG TPA: DUF3800 domain-containing protein [Candidatus Angelobacter sp.]|nr:DUF3800 domain-containing protein [Candidatus Angelobacter sp.]